MSDGNSMILSTLCIAELVAVDDDIFGFMTDVEGSGGPPEAVIEEIVVIVGERLCAGTSCTSRSMLFV